MSLFGLLSMIGGLALFLYGMHIMSEGLEKVSGLRKFWRILPAANGRQCFLAQE